MPHHYGPERRTLPRPTILQRQTEAIHRVPPRPIATSRSLSMRLNPKRQADPNPRIPRRLTTLCLAFSRRQAKPALTGPRRLANRCQAGSVRRAEPGAVLPVRKGCSLPGLMYDGLYSAGLGRLVSIDRKSKAPGPLNPSADARQMKGLSMPDRSIVPASTSLVNPVQCSAGCGRSGPTNGRGCSRSGAIAAYICAHCRGLAGSWLERRKTSGLSPLQAAALLRIRVDTLEQIEAGLTEPLASLRNAMTRLYSGRSAYPIVVQR